MQSTVFDKMTRFKWITYRSAPDKWDLGVDFITTDCFIHNNDALFSDN